MTSESRIEKRSGSRRGRRFARGVTVAVAGAIGVAAAGFGGVAEAQVIGQSLRGLNAMQVFVGGLDPSVESCGVTKAAVEQAARGALAQSRIPQSGIRPGDPTTPAQVMVGIGILDADIGCVTSVQVDVMTQATIRATNATARASVWTTNRLLMSQRANTPRRTIEAVESAVGELVSDWNAVNP